jgi:hypothetical protein
MRNCSFLILLLVGIPFYGVAQQHPGTSVASPVQLLPGLGNHHHPIATKSPEAQKFFDQGLALAYSISRTSKKLCQPCLPRAGALGEPPGQSPRAQPA